jgi:serine/threonine protein kinase
LIESCSVILSSFNARLSHRSLNFFLVYHVLDLCGTPGYLAPEMLRCNMFESDEGYGQKVDMYVSTRFLISVNLIDAFCIDSFACYSQLSCLTCLG